MASLRKLPNSPYWIACFTAPGGTRTQRSTKVPTAGVKNEDLKPLRQFLARLLGVEVKTPAHRQGLVELDTREAKKLAQRIANKFEDAAKDAREGRLIEGQARKVIAEIYALGNRAQLPNSSIRDFFQAWLKRKELEAGETTFVRYGVVVEQFLNHLGGKSTADVSHVTSREVTEFRDSVAKRMSASTVNFAIKTLRAALNQAKRDGLVETNQAERVSLLKRLGRSKRRPFALDELKHILKVANEEWRGMILVGLYTGLRLGDIATLTWANLDLQDQRLHLATRKTGRVQDLPIAKPLLNFLESVPAGDDPEQPVFPSACHRYLTRYNGTLSKEFYQIMVSAGLAPARESTVTGKGNSVPHMQNALSFHCLRHTATSLLKNAGVSDVVARDIIGHDSAAVSRVYTHIDMETKRKAVDGMPDVFAPSERES